MANPPRGDTYDGVYWNKSPGDPRLTSIRQHFANFGYPVNVGPWAMNVLGPLGSVEFKNEPGSTPAKGRLGGEDDKKSAVVKNFQIDYNIVSKAKLFTSGMGRVSEDGLMGPFTLNAMRYATEKIGGKHWPDVVKEAKGKGFATPAYAKIPTTKPKQMVFQKPSGTGTGTGTGEGEPDDAGGTDEYGAAAAAPTKKGSAMPLVAGAALLLMMMAKKK